MNNFRKRIGHLLCLCFTLAILVTCFMASGITASATKYEVGYACRYCACLGYQGSNTTDNAECTACGHRHLSHRTLGDDTIVMSECSLCSDCQLYDPADPGHILTPCRACNHLSIYHFRDGASHNHNYSTPDWGAWRKISSCRLPG